MSEIEAPDCKREQRPRWERSSGASSGGERSGGERSGAPALSKRSGGERSGSAYPHALRGVHRPKKNHRHG